MPDVVLKDVSDGPADTPDRDTRLTLRLSPEVRHSLEWIANERSVSLVEAIRRALGTEKFLMEVSKRKARILIEQPGERLKELVII